MTTTVDMAATPAPTSELSPGFRRMENGVVTRVHHDDCPVCHGKLTHHSPNGFDKIFECHAAGHHRHMIRGITGEYVTMSALMPKRIQNGGSL
ncbi:hypothetical protein PQH03_28640 [Ralstonia insidiosa]|jgi:hypothetical protein|uniref:hypothetical protein n=1 Tax=Ralstonia TaxID=48736 RepID=UPI0009B89D14|nr:MULTISPECIES: hypothetical protein [Ralstonia]MBA9869653.1 hypothetical protein [Ralstonia insidiosa]MBA9884414.1 hypothetical protein [Ralstonia pickettii]MBA9894098.1 hypothetical protein [Ralstonia pickettii]MBA9913638.1 hypothetical protein [Ralstonia insidiosa]MBA9926152.1 hypothetical protein [Ralstonia pickettii]